jgi:hypothetical protein
MAERRSRSREKPEEVPSALGRFFRNPATGKLAVVQLPNIPLAIFLIATVARLASRADGAAGTALSVVAGLSLVWWSVDEIARGDSVFRRVLGAAVLIGFSVGRLMR